MFTLIDLPYKSLAPVVSDQTLSFHHGKHLQAYVDNLNKLIAGTAFEGKSLEEIIVLSSGAKAGAEKVPAVFNNINLVVEKYLYGSYSGFIISYINNCILANYNIFSFDS